MSDAKYIRERRVENYKALETLFKENNLGELVFKNLSAGTAPYVFPFIVKQPAEQVSKEFIKLGIPAYTWPDLPETIKNNKADHYWANWYAEHLLLIPVHQNVTVGQVEYVKKHLAKIL